MIKALIGALIVLGVAALALSFVSWPARATKQAVSVTATVTPVVLTGDPAYGRALFAAKGCAMCHYHRDVQRSGVGEIGPQLSTYRPNPDFVRSWLRDPGALRPGARMPALGLSDEEIEALLAFLAAGPRN